MSAAHLNKSTVLFDVLFEKLCTYSDFIELESVPYRQTQLGTRKAVREEFTESAKNNYWRWITKHNISEFKLLGCDDFDLGLLQVGEIPPNMILPALSKYSIDHIRPIFAGGTNDPSNLNLLPNDVHSIKSKFESVQLLINPRRTDLQVVRRKLNEDGYPSILPFGYTMNAPQKVMQP